MAERFSFDHWGLKRDAATWSNFAGSSTTPPSSVSDRGYTGHHQLDNLGLVHMGGRVYDPALGRMMQSDPIVRYHRTGRITVATATSSTIR